MRYFKSQTASVTCMALLSATLAVSFRMLAQESAQPGDQRKNLPTKETDSNKKTYDWRKVADGIWEAHISPFPHSENAKWEPEFAVVRLTAVRYAEFEKNRIDFLNDHHIFGKKIKTQESCPVTSEVQQATAGERFLVLVHWPDSMAACQAYTSRGEPKS